MQIEHLFNGSSKPHHQQYALRREETTMRALFPVKEEIFTRVMFHRIMLDRVGRIKVFIEPLDAQTDYLVGLQLVTESGSLFKLEDLDDMCLRPDNIGEFMELCERRFEKLCHVYFGCFASEDIKFIPGRCEIDEEMGEIHVECALEC